MSQEQLKKQMIEWRHYLHQNPESAFEETGTADFVADKLTAMGLEVHRNIGRTGVVGILKCGDGTDVIGLRADMDCIQLTETSNLSYASKTPNRMHACGHDGHTTVLLGAAKLLAERKNFNGTVCFVFQPALLNKSELADRMLPAGAAVMRCGCCPACLTASCGSAP